ncbi:MAG: hypothetical protein ACI4V7_08275 [Succinivibrionaceae bacterium]
MCSLLNKFFCPFVATFLFSSVSADCLDDVNKYRLDLQIYDECAEEAEKTKNNKVQFLMAMWNLNGIQEPHFSKNSNHNAYKHYIFLSSVNGNQDAKAMYVTTEYSNGRDGADVNIDRFLKSLNDDAKNSDEALLRLLKTKIAIKTFNKEKDSTDLQNLIKLADNKNIEAIFFLAKYYLSLNDEHNAKKYYEEVISIADNDLKNLSFTSLKAGSYWDLFSYYAMNAITPVQAKFGIPYIEKLAYMGDTYAQIIYAGSLLSPFLTYDKIKNVEAYSWIRIAQQCSINDTFNTIFENRLQEKNKELFKSLPTELSKDELKKSDELVNSLLKKVNCMKNSYKEKPKKEENLKIKKLENK